MVLEMSCWIIEKITYVFNFYCVKTLIFGYFSFWDKNTLKLQQLFKKRPKSSNCLIIFHISLKKNPFFDVDLFSRAFDMESPQKSDSLSPPLSLHNCPVWQQNSSFKNIYSSNDSVFISYNLYLSVCGGNLSVQ